MELIFWIIWLTGKNLTAATSPGVTRTVIFGFFPTVEFWHNLLFLHNFKFSTKKNICKYEVFANWVSAREKQSNNEEVFRFTCSVGESC